jgi:uncharacterized protein YprB with RNaseH-like and TPR domain
MFDIEAGDIHATADQMLLACFKPYEREPYCISRKAQDTTDEELVKKVKTELLKYDILVTYNGINYDIAFLNARLIKHYQKPMPRKLHIDCYKVAKRQLKWVTYNRKLVSLCELAGIEDKTRVKYEIWERAKYGSKIEKLKALYEIKDHCLKDVIVLEQMYDKTFKYGVSGVTLA